MVEGQKVKPVRTGIVHLIFGVVSLDSQRAGPLSKIQRDSFTGWKDIRPVRLKDVAIDFRAGFVRGISLERVRGLSKLQIEAASPPAAGVDIGCVLENQRGLIEAELVAQHVIGAKQVHTPNRLVEIVFIVRIQR